MYAIRSYYAGQVEHRLCQRQLAFRRTEPFIRLAGIQRETQGARIGQPDVFARHAHDATSQIARIRATVEHAHHPIQRCIRIGAADRFVQRRDLVVEDLPRLV